MNYVFFQENSCIFGERTLFPKRGRFSPAPSLEIGFPPAESLRRKSITRSGFFTPWWAEPRPNTGFLPAKYTLHLIHLPLVSGKNKKELDQQMGPAAGESGFPATCQRRNSWI
jgi:hypothetical protein